MYEHGLDFLRGEFGLNLENIESQGLYELLRKYLNFRDSTLLKE